MTVLVTGSMGHVGFEVVRQAVGRDHRVIAVYRPAGPNGPGFTSQEVKLHIPE